MSVKYGGILCIEMFVPGETYISATKFGWLCDEVSENEKLSITGF